MIYTVVLLATGAGATFALASEFRRGLRNRDRPDGWPGVVAWIVAELLLALGIWSFAVVGITHADGVDIGRVWIAPAATLTGLAFLAAVQPVRTARHLRRGALLLPALIAVLTVVTYVVDRVDFIRTTFGPVMMSAVFVSAPALLTAAFLRLAVKPRSGPLSLPVNGSRYAVDVRHRSDRPASR